MFYANGMAKPSAGARKKIHGGSGLSGNGDSYGPGCRCPSSVIDPHLSRNLKLPHFWNSTRYKFFNVSSSARF